MLHNHAQYLIYEGSHLVTVNTFIFSGKYLKFLVLFYLPNLNKMLQKFRILSGI